MPGQFLAGQVHQGIDQRFQVPRRRGCIAELLPPRAEPRRAGALALALGLVVRVPGRGQAVINELDAKDRPALAVQPDNVFRLDVPVHDVATVQRPKCRNQLQPNLKQLVWRHGVLLLGFQYLV